MACHWCYVTCISYKPAVRSCGAVCFLTHYFRRNITLAFFLVFLRLICGFKCVQTRLSITVFPQKSFIYWFYQPVMMWPRFIISLSTTNGDNKILSLLQYLLTRVFALKRISLIKYLIILSYSFCRKGRENAWLFFF